MTTPSEREARGFTEADVRHLWKCGREFDCTIPDQALDAMRDYLLSALTRREAQGVAS